MDLPFTDYIYVNNRLAGREEKVYENFTVEWSLEPKKGFLAEAAALVEAELEESEQESKEVFKRPLSYQEGVDAKEAVLKKEEPSIVRLTVNGQPVILKEKSRYSFVDILDFYPFDVSQAHGQTVVMQINGEKAEFTSPVNTGDSIDLYWK